MDTLSFGARSRGLAIVIRKFGLAGWTRRYGLTSTLGNQYNINGAGSVTANVNHQEPTDEARLKWSVVAFHNYEVVTLRALQVRAEQSTPRMNTTSSTLLWTSGNQR